MTQSQFSIDHLVTEVNTIVEDLRWLHFELKLRNHLNELLFHEVTSVEEFLKNGFEGFRAKISVLEVTVYLKNKNSYSIGFRDLEESVFWGNDTVPWTEHLNALFRQPYDFEESPQPYVNHYSVNNDPITSISMPVIIDREVIAVVILVAHTSNLIPRFKKLLTGLSVALSVSINYIKNVRKLYKPAAMSVKFADNSLPYDDVLQFLDLITKSMHEHALVTDNLGNILVWNKSIENYTGIQQEEATTLQDIKQIFATNSTETLNLYESLATNTAFDLVTAPITGQHNEPSLFVWSLKKIGTTKGALSLVTGAPLPVGTIETTSVSSQETAIPLWLHRAFTDIESVYIAVMNSSFQVVYLNPQIRKKLALENGTAVGEHFVQASVPKHEHRYVESALKTYLTAQEPRQSNTQFHLVSKKNETIPVDWHIGSLTSSENEGTSLWLFGSEVPDELFQVTKDLELKHFPYRSGEAKLSKHYRFLMKYVPFPIVHLDEEEDVVRNANIAFEEIIGTRNWESSPMSDFGTLTIHQGVGEAHPCTLYILNPDGITLTYRGIMTPLQIFGKRIRELKLDPLD